MQTPQPLPRVASPLDIPQLIRDCMKSSLLNKVTFTRIYPDIPVTGPVIVWRLVRRVLGKEGIETKKPRIRGFGVAGNDKLVTYWGQWTTAVFQFDLFHTSEDEADDLMRKFELFIMESRHILGMSGVDSFIFEEQLQDYSLPTPKEIPQRSIRYVATMTSLYPVYTPRVHQISLSIASTGEVDNKEMTRSADAEDLVGIQYYRILSIGNTPDTVDYVAGVDYDLVEADSGTKIVWLPHGLHPEGGANYYIRYSALVDPVSFSVAGQIPTK